MRYPALRAGIFLLTHYKTKDTAYIKDVFGFAIMRLFLLRLYTYKSFFPKKGNNNKKGAEFYLIVSSGKIFLAGHVSRNVEEKINSLGEPYASFPLVVNRPGKNGQESKHTYNICAKGNSYMYATGKNNSGNRVEIGDRIVVCGDFRAMLNVDLVIPMLDSAIQSVEMGKANEAIETLHQLKETCVKGYCPSDKSRPLIFNNVFISGYGDSLEVTCRRNRTRLSDEISASGVREFFPDLSDKEFIRFIVDTIRTLGERHAANIEDPAAENATVDATILLDEARRHIAVDVSPNPVGDLLTKSAPAGIFNFDGSPI